MRLLRVVAHLDAPVMLRDVVHLDAILASAWVVRHPKEAQRGSVPRTYTLHVHHAGHTVTLSSAVAPAGEPTLVHATKRRDPSDVDRLAGSFTPGSGPSRDMLIRDRAHVTPRLEWLAFGSRREILRALELRTSIGAMRRHGWGDVRRWDVEPVDGDPLTCWVRDGVAQRHLPLAWCSSWSRTTGAPTFPPYFGRADHCVPCGARAELRPEVAAAALDLIQRHGQC